jgi:hypothetical protein
MRMRRRRLERCLLRGSAALDAGVLDAAREALEEARSLSPDEPEVLLLSDRLALAELAPPEPVLVVDDDPAGSTLLSVAAQDSIDANAGESAHPGRWMAVPATMIVISGAAGWFWAQVHLDPAERPGPAVTSRALPTAPPTSASDSLAVPPALESVPLSPPLTETSSLSSDLAVSVPGAAPDVSETPRIDGGLAGTTGGAAAQSNVVDSSVGSQALSPALIQSDLPMPRAFELPVPPANASPSSAPAAESSARPDSGVAVPPVQPVSTLPEPLPAPAPLPSPPPSADAPAARAGQPALHSAGTTVAPSAPSSASEGDERSVRSILSRYEAAYSNLDAAAASAVWPSVDQRALARAFEDLESQSLALGRCDVQMNSATALADCTGSVRWTPKVGSGARSSARKWRFELRNNGGDWIILRAEVR